MYLKRLYCSRLHLSVLCDFSILSKLRYILLLFINAHSFGEPLISEKIHSAVKKVLSEGFATKDIAQKNSIIVSTSEMGDKIAKYVS